MFLQLLRPESDDLATKIKDALAKAFEETNTAHSYPLVTTTSILLSLSLVSNSKFVQTELHTDPNTGVTYYTGAAREGGYVLNFIGLKTLTLYSESGMCVTN